MIRETKCRRCGKPIVMIKTIKHKTMPADAEPLWIRLGVDGEQFLREDGMLVWGEEAGDAADDDGAIVEAYRPHITTCRKSSQ